VPQSVRLWYPFPLLPYTILSPLKIKTFSVGKQENFPLPYPQILSILGEHVGDTVGEIFPVCSQPASCNTEGKAIEAIFSVDFSAGY
jgi:hypothetical protein